IKSTDGYVRTPMPVRHRITHFGPGKKMAEAGPNEVESAEPRLLGGVMLRATEIVPIDLDRKGLIGVSCCWSISSFGRFSVAVPELRQLLKSAASCTFCNT